jgi:hypothetical protein
MEVADLSEIQLRHIYSIGGLLARNKMHHFRKSINNHKDGVITFLVIGKPNTKSLLTLVYGPSGIGRRMYNPTLVADPLDT